MATCLKQRHWLSLEKLLVWLCRARTNCNIVVPIQSTRQCLLGVKWFCCFISGASGTGHTFIHRGDPLSTLHRHSCLHLHTFSIYRCNGPVWSLCLLTHCFLVLLDGLVGTTGKCNVLLQPTASVMAYCWWLWNPADVL